LDARYQQNPERFVKDRPAVRLPPAFVAINPILAEDGDKVLADHVNFPTITAAGYVSDKGKQMLSQN
jgi:putative transposase